VQRLKNQNGINMKWIWDNIKNGTKLVVWEDYQGRQVEIPSDDTLLYYNPNGGSNYHTEHDCRGIKEKYWMQMESFTYGELEDDKFASLTPCPYCQPPRRLAELEEINRIHLESSPGEVMSYWKK
jgi:hypothetical protein